ncbi:MAG: hypothetical protein ACM336_04355 [Acidobacteriota bacterium]
MIFAALLAAALLNQTVRVPAAGTREFEIAVKQRSAVLDCEFHVERGGSGVRVALMQNRHALATTGYTRAHRFRFPLPAGEYTLVVDNRLEGRRPADVRLSLKVEEAAGLPEPRTLSPRRRAVVVASSVLFFVLVAYFAGRKLRKALRERPDAGADGEG